MELEFTPHKADLEPQLLTTYPVIFGGHDMKLPI